MNPKTTCLWVLTVLASVSGLTAQKMPLGGDDPRILQLHDVRDVLESRRGDEEGAAVASPDRKREQLGRLERFVRTFLDPPLEQDEDIRALGLDHLILLGRPEQQAWLERLLVHERKVGSYSLVLEIRVLDVPKVAFEKLFKPLFEVADTWKPMQTVLARNAKTEAWLAATLKDPRIDVLTAPRLLALPLQRAEIVIGEKISYVKDFEVEFARGRAIANPIVAEILDGIRIDTTCSLIGKDTIGLTFDFEQCKVEAMEKFETTLAGGDTKLTIDLPTSRSIRLQQKIRLPDRGLAIVSAPNNDRYAAAIVSARIVPQ